MMLILVVLLINWKSSLKRIYISLLHIHNHHPQNPNGKILQREGIIGVITFSVKPFLDNARILIHSTTRFSWRNFARCIISIYFVSQGRPLDPYALCQLTLLATRLQQTMSTLHNYNKHSRGGTLRAKVLIAL